MNYPRLLYQITTYALILYPLAAVVLLAAILGTTKAFRASVYGVVLFAGLTCLAAFLFPRAGMGMIVLLIIIGVGAGVVSLLYLVYSHYREAPTFRLSRPIRIALAVTGVFILIVNAVAANRFEVSSAMCRRAVLTGDLASLNRWKNSSEREIWRAMAERPKGSETLKLIQAIVELGYAYPGSMHPYEGYQMYVGTTRLVPLPPEKIDKDNVWNIVLAHPASEQRLNAVRALTQRHAPPAFFLAGLYDQKDQQSFEAAARYAVAQNSNFSETIHILALAERYDVIEASESTVAAADQPIRSSQKDAKSDTADKKRESHMFISAVNLYEFFDNQRLFAKYVHSGAALDALEPHTKKTALMLALEKGYSEAAQLLIQAGADARIKDKAGRTALFYAVMYNREAAFTELLAASENPSEPDIGGVNPLHWAAWTGNHTMAHALLAKGIPADGTNPAIPSPLFYAVIGGGPKTLEHLLNRLGSDASALALQANAKGVTPFALAARGLKPDRVCHYLDGQSGPELIPWSFGLKRSLRGEANWETMLQRKSRTVALLLAAGADPYRGLAQNNNILHAFFCDTFNPLPSLKDHLRDPYGSRQRHYWCPDQFTAWGLDELFVGEYSAMLDAMIPLGESIRNDEMIAKLCRNAVNADICREKLTVLSQERQP